MTFQSFVESFLKFEENYRMFERRLNEIQFWYLIRFRIFNDIARRLSVTGYNNPTGNGGTFYSRKLCERIYASTLGSQYHLRCADILVIPDRRLFAMRENDLYKDIYTNLLCKNLNRSYITLYFGDEYGTKFPLDCRNVIYADVDDYIERSRIGKEQTQRIEKDEFSREVITPIIDGFGIEVESDLKYTWMSVLYAMISDSKKYYKYFEYIIKKIRPKLVLCVDSYNPQNMTLCEVSKKFNVPVAELQHGAVNVSHISYNYPDGIYKPLWFPDYFLSFGELEKKSRFPIDKNNIIPVGYPELEASVCQKKHSKTILFVSQASVAIAEFAVAFEKIAGKKFKILYKLHPFEYGRWREIYGSLFDKSNIMIIDGNGNTIHEYLNKCDWVVGVSSTTLIEAMMYNLKVAIIKKLSFDSMKELYENKNAVLVENEDELLSYVRNDDFQPFNPRLYFKKNGINNILMFVDKVIKNR